MLKYLLNSPAVQTLKTELQRYLALQRQELVLTLVLKLTLLLSALAVALVLFVVGIIAAFYASFALTAWLEQLTGSVIVANSVMAGVFVVVAVVVYLCRKRLIERPIVTLLTRILYTEKYDSKPHTDASSAS